MKRLVSILVALAMLLTIAPMSIFATEAEAPVFSDVKDTDYYAQAAKALEAADILAGYPDGTFGAEKTITRAEMAAIVCRMIDKEEESKEAAGETLFDDVAAEHWASGYINVASKEGIINGDGDGNFRPEDDVKYEEAIKMVVCALGFAENVEVDPKDWSKAYLDIAKDKKITDKLTGEKGQAATRGDVAVMSFSGLEVLVKEATEAAIANGTPIASVAGGTYTSKQTVSLTSSAEGAVIYYTLNGTTPTVKSTKYSKPITISKTSTLKAIAVLDGKTIGDVMSVLYTINIKSSGSALLGPIYSTITISAAELQVNGAAVTQANVGDVLTLATTPQDATGTIVWTVGGNEIANTTNTYTVTTFDMGKTIKAEITGTGSFTGTVSAQCTVANATEVTAQDIMTGDVDSSPVVLTDAENTTFLDDAGNPVEVTADSTLTLSIENPETTEEEVSQAATLAIESFVANSTATAEDLADVTAVAVDVDLSIDETAVHPVGDVTVNLSAEQLGLPAGTDLTNYTFSANHTNKEGTNEIVPGTLVTIDNIQYVRFELNGLSTIWIGNVPPRTVSFYITEEDADSKTNSIGEVIVKFGDFTPTAKIPTPTRSGYLFTGWNYDMTRTPIISNLEVHANWIEGVKMPEGNISALFSDDTDALSLEISDGLVSVDCEEAALVPSNLDMKVTVTAPDNAVKYYVGMDAAVVAAFNNTEEYLDVNADISFVVDVTDENGIIVPSANTYYYKWIDETGAAISIQEVKAKIANGSETATSKEYTANVNRGIGTFEAYVIDNEDPTKDYVGYINNHLSGRAIDGYDLSTNLSFDGRKVNYNFADYDYFKFVFTPFEGMSYSTTDTIVATGEYYNGNTWNENWTGTYQIADGKLIVTYPLNLADMPNNYAYIFVTVNDVTQEIDINWHHSRNTDGNTENIQCETWADVIAKLPQLNSTTEYYIFCNDNSPITLTNALTIPANVDIYLDTATAFTIANGATLTVQDNADNHFASSLTIGRGDFIVENGGAIIASYIGTSKGSRYYPNIQANNLIFRTGSSLTISEDSLLSLHSSYYDESECGTLTFETGSTITNNNGNFDVYDFDVVNFSGTFTSTNYSYIYSDEINISGDITATPEGWGYLEFYGTVNVTETGRISVNNVGSYNHTYTNLEIYGPLNNNGTIEIKGNKTNAEIMNNGFVNYNNGTISVAAGCSITTSGTKYINTGVISGAGTLYATLGDDYTNYDDGTDWVDVENDRYWDETLGTNVYKLSDYSRYKYTHDPAETVDAILYLSEIINMGEGTCTLTIDTEAFPQE